MLFSDFFQMKTAKKSIFNQNTTISHFSESRGRTKSSWEILRGNEKIISSCLIKSFKDLFKILINSYSWRKYFFFNMNNNYYFQITDLTGHFFFVLFFYLDNFFKTVFLLEFRLAWVVVCVLLGCSCCCNHDCYPCILGAWESSWN